MVFKSEGIRAGNVTVFGKSELITPWEVETELQVATFAWTGMVSFLMETASSHWRTVNN